MRFYPVFQSKSSEKFGKSSEKFGNFGKSSDIWKKFGNFGNWFFRMFGNFGNFKNLEIPNFPKITKKWRSTRTSEITKYSFRLRNRPESSVKSSECRALKCSLSRLFFFKTKDLQIQTKHTFKHFFIPLSGEH